MGTLRKPAGFTLLELLVVVVIIAILAGIAVPSYNRFIEKTLMRDAEGKLNLIFQAERIYRLDNGIYGTGAQLIPNYLPNPDTTEWVFTDAVVPTADAFQVMATRQTGSYATQTITIDQTNTLTYSAGYAGGIPQ